MPAVNPMLPPGIMGMSDPFFALPYSLMPVREKRIGFSFGCFQSQLNQAERDWITEKQASQSSECPRETTPCQTSPLPHQNNSLSIIHLIYDGTRELIDRWAPTAANVKDFFLRQKFWVKSAESLVSRRLYSSYQITATSYNHLVGPNRRGQDFSIFPTHA